MSRVKAAVFASGTGSNFQAMLEERDLACEIVLLVCDRPGAAVIEKAKQNRIPVYTFEPKRYATKEAYEKEILTVLQQAGISWIFLAGYMRIIGPCLLHAYQGKIVNIHPSLLPAFPGKDAIKQAFNTRAEKTGVTVHFIDEGIDTGPIIAQQVVDIYPSDTIDLLTKRIQKVEHQLYPSVIKQLIQNEGDL
ncbi:phosphoribosylglycinamide formyltransferase [Virgibacillus pantothenticus]|uniref:Phosphoribosylglycinamide formyltransferase n=1 Tax=Virgibacillus pantothenticus TaxID=1473 RepID=A0A0L0QL08_VIRPA|nr:MULTISPECIES: phosphoribosylglycinamide formyltransferase [Virgibacillus]API91434.1 phosphoribosylglycinamide formyltransferase [Virgibacillus sp. 6R]KNE19194.1 phosphoribosylglycinamide formyltransferase [Virgibacillus pantothenticus]MBS7426686.1 phosphoribosylglycinamide formyltransferase [Virgibacillus sp. 19R1-5]MBU8568410.1 phosphoribosylglycinamide formyltransferase [Virgibacillus pantothenticus]MBU8602406.1 phosphoribosylglycinamide formyltransferase [Virgibacillus pantothenticus]